jgi:hypothetical protein
VEIDCLDLVNALTSPLLLRKLTSKYIKEDNMRIELDGTLVKMTPENDPEKKELNNVWRILIDCVNKTRKLVPVGEYLPGIKEVAVFNIEE